MVDVSLSGYSAGSHKCSVDEPKTLFIVKKKHLFYNQNNDTFHAIFISSYIEKNKKRKFNLYSISQNNEIRVKKYYYIDFHFYYVY